MIRVAPWLIFLSLGFAPACFAQVGFVDPIVVEVEAGKFAPLKVDFPAKIVALSPTKPASLEGRLVETKEGWALTLGGGVTRASLLFVGPAGGDGLPQLVQIDATLKGTPEPGPEPPGPNPPPDVEGVAKAVRDLASSFPAESKVIAPTAGAIYSRAAQKLRDRSETNIAALLASVKAEINALYISPQIKADWSKLSGTIAPAWDAMFAKEPTLDDIADFLAQISIGLEGVR